MSRHDMEPSTTQKMLSAVYGSVITSLLVTPLDVVRVRLQSQDYTPSSNSSSARNTSSLPAGRLRPQFSSLPQDIGISTCCREVFFNNNASYCVAGPTVAPTTPSSAAICAAEEVQKKTFTSTLDGIRKIARNEGILTLWRGLSPTLVMAVPANVIYFAGYDWLRHAPQSPFMGTLGEGGRALAAGAVARTLAAIAVGPVEMFRTRMQAAHSTTTSGHIRETFNGMGELVQSQGYRTLWRGLGLTLWRDVPFSSLYWWGYETTRNALTDSRELSSGDKFGIASAARTDKSERRKEFRRQESITATGIDSFVGGGVSGAFAAFVTTPFDVGKTRQQVFQHGKEAGKEAAKGMRPPEELSMPRFLLHIFREQGMSGLFRGWAARCLKVSPACAIMVSSYEIGKKYANDSNERRLQAA